MFPEVDWGSNEQFVAVDTLKRNPQKVLFLTKIEADLYQSFVNVEKFFAREIGN